MRGAPADTNSFHNNVMGPSGNRFFFPKHKEITQVCGSGCLFWLLSLKCYFFGSNVTSCHQQNIFLNRNGRSRSRSSHTLYSKYTQAAILHTCCPAFCGPHIPEGFSEVCGRHYTTLNELSWKPGPLPEHLKWEQSTPEHSAPNKGLWREEK